MVLPDWNKGWSNMHATRMFNRVKHNCHFCGVLSEQHEVFFFADVLERTHTSKGWGVCDDHFLFSRGKISREEADERVMNKVWKDE